jgi:hypothetical protein
MAEHSNSGADPRSAGGAAEDEFAVSEHAFTEKLNTEASSETRERLEEMGEAGKHDGAGRTRPDTGETASRMFGEIATFTRRQPLEALLGAFVAGIVIGLFARR